MICIVGFEDTKTKLFQSFLDDLLLIRHSRVQKRVQIWLVVHNLSYFKFDIFCFFILSSSMDHCIHSMLVVHLLYLLIMHIFLINLWLIGRNIDDRLINTQLTPLELLLVLWTVIFILNLLAESVPLHFRSYRTDVFFAIKICSILLLYAHLLIHIIA